LFVVVMGLCLLLGWQVIIVRNREALREEMRRVQHVSRCVSQLHPSPLSPIITA
jgi:hypothetical protein